MEKIYPEQRSAQALLGIAALLLAYGAGSWALDSGSLLAYSLLVGLVVLAVTYFVKAVKSPRRNP